MPEYTITPEDEPSWRFAPEDFAARIAARWPDARTGVNDLAGSPMVAHALVPFEPPRRELGVALSGLGFAVVLDPADPDTADEFVAWYVTQVPGFDRPVYLFTEDYETRLALHAGTTADEVRAFLSQH